MIKKNQDYIQQDFENEKEGTVKEYVDFHIEELGDDFLEKIGISNPNRQSTAVFNQIIFNKSWALSRWKV